MHRLQKPGWYNNKTTIHALTMKKFLCILIIIQAGCKDVYNPTLKNAPSGYLVVDGNIIAGNDSTIVHLTRSVSVSDTSIVINETGASVKVESGDGDTYELQNENNGIYAAPALNISLNKNYRLHIFTADGKEYASDFVPVVQTPPIDSVSWKLDPASGVSIYISTHDATNSTQYYQWQYVETWEHRAKYNSILIYDPTTQSLNGRSPEQQVYRCWNVQSSTDIQIFSSTNLSSDVVFEKPLLVIPYGSEKIDRVYSILVTQQALSKDAYEFWDDLKKNTETLGTIFDPQPFANFGNVHCLTNPQEAVIGFINACTIQRQRIFINWLDVQWPYSFPPCGDTIVQPIDIQPTFSHVDIYVPINYVPSPPGAVFGSLVECADCRLGGGTTVRPSYMPN